MSNSKSNSISPERSNDLYKQISAL